MGKYEIVLKKNALKMIQMEMNFARWPFHALDVLLL